MNWVLRGNLYTCKEGNSVKDMFASYANIGLLQKERICTGGESSFLFFRSRFVKQVKQTVNTNYLESE